MTWLQIIGLAESAVILSLAEPALNRMSPCAPFIVRLAFHAIAAGSAIRVYHILSGHSPSWSAALQLSGFTALLLIDHFWKRRRKEDRVGKRHYPLPDE